MWISPNTDFGTFELDEIYWFITARKGDENGINTYVMTMISRKPRQILAFAVDNSRTQRLIQQMVDSVPAADNYATDGYYGYGDIIFPGRHIQNADNKNDTFLVEGTNADLRHYVAGLRRKSRCFFRTIETFQAVIWLVANAYNKFGEAKRAWWERDIYYGRDFNFSHLDYI